MRITNREFFAEIRWLFLSLGLTLGLSTILFGWGSIYDTTHIKINGSHLSIDVLTIGSAIFFLITFLIFFSKEFFYYYRTPFPVLIAFFSGSLLIYKIAKFLMIINRSDRQDPYSNINVTMIVIAMVILIMCFFIMFRRKRHLGSLASK